MQANFQSLVQEMFPSGYLYSSCGSITEKLLSKKLDEKQNAEIGIPSKILCTHSSVLAHLTLLQLTGEEGVLQIVPTTFPSI